MEFRMKRSITKAGGLEAIGRWLSEAIPPGTGDRKRTAPCKGARGRQENRTAGLNAQRACTPPGCANLVSCSGGVASLNHRLIASSLRLDSAD